jgi:DNA-binding NarL/FixJ family response regulator
MDALSQPQVAARITIACEVRNRAIVQTEVMGPIRIMIVDDQPSIRQGLRMRLAREADLAVVAEAENGEAAVKLAAIQRPDVVVMDVEMPVMDGIEATRELTAARVGCAVVMLSIHDSQAIRQAAGRAGACAFIAKHEPGAVLLAAVRRAVSGTETD